MICFRNKDSKKNFGDKSGREFAIFFEDKSSYFIYRDGTKELAKADAEKDRIMFEANAKHPNGELYVIDFKDIKWNLLDFSEKI